MRTVGPAGQNGSLTLPPSPWEFFPVSSGLVPPHCPGAFALFCTMRSQRNDRHPHRCKHLLHPQCSPPLPWDKTPSPHGLGYRSGCNRCAVCGRTGRTQDGVAALQLAWCLPETGINDEPLEGQLCRRIQESVQQLGAARRGPLPVAGLLPKPSSASLGWGGGRRSGAGGHEDIS